MSDERERTVSYLIQKVRRSVQFGEPLYLTCGRVYHEAVGSLDDATLDALAHVGFTACKRDGVPASPLTGPLVNPVAVEAIGEQYEAEKAGPETRSALAFIGFLALTAERFASPEDDA